MNELIYKRERALIPTTLLVFMITILLLSAFLHGMVGFGFPLYATPLLALFLNIKLVVILTVIPNLLINIVCTFQGGISSPQMKAYWSMAVYVLLGTLVGTQALLYLNQDILKIMLVLMIGAYLIQDKFKKLTVIKRLGVHPFTGPIMGLLAGFLSGSVNVSSVPLVLYYLSIGLLPMALIQVLNLAFGAGKAAQFVSLGLAGEFNNIAPYILISLSIASVLGLLVGLYFNNKFSVEGYRKLVSRVLAVIAVTLILQVFQDLFYKLRSLQ
jgi:uncharacterized protein